MGIYDSHRKRMSYSGCRTDGQILKAQSDEIMEQTWMNDIQSKCCFIYDFEHDDQPELNKHMTYEDTTKTKIDAKFIVKSYGSMDKDQVEYHLQFRPSQKLEFDDEDELYYFEENYRKKYGISDFPISFYVDIPDENGVYCKWLVCDREEGNQFTKYQILPCDYRFQWISIENGRRVKRQMWGCTRSMNSYTSGIWRDYNITSLDDVNKILLPLNSIAQSFGHLKENGENQRVIFSAKTDNPSTWVVSKIENTKPIGLIKATLKEETFNPNTDYIERDDDGNIIGMYADYYDSQFTPVEPDEVIPQPKDYIHCLISSSNYTLRNNGSYKTITSKYLDENDKDVSRDYSNEDRDYYFEIDGVDVSSDIIYTEQTDKNIIKLKFNNSDYIGKILTIKTNTITDNVWGKIELEII